jgi:hypothetical protein
VAGVKVIVLLFAAYVPTVPTQLFDASDTIVFVAANVGVATHEGLPAPPELKVRAALLAVLL